MNFKQGDKVWLNTPQRISAHIAFIENSNKQPVYSVRTCTGHIIRVKAQSLSPNLPSPFQT